MNALEKEKITHVLLAAKQKGTRIRLFHGDADTGEDWAEEYDTLGYIGRSAGVSPCWLLVHNTHCYGGSPVGIEHVIRITTAKGGNTLYVSPNYKTPNAVVIGTPNQWGVYVNDSLAATFPPDAKGKKQADRYVSFITGATNHK